MSLEAVVNAVNLRRSKIKPPSESKTNTVATTLKIATTFMVTSPERPTAILRARHRAST
jgi:hypothetical protein